MPISPRRFTRREVTFPRVVSIPYRVPDPNNDIVQFDPLHAGPHTTLSDLGTTDIRQAPRRYVAPTKSGTTGGITGLRTKGVI